MSDQAPVAPPSEKPANALPKWEIGAADFGIFIALLLACMVVGSSLGALVVEYLSPTPPDGEPSLMAILAQNLGMQLGLLVAYFGFRHLTKPAEQLQAPSEAIGKNPVLVALKWLVIAYAFIFVFGGLWQWALTALGYEQVMQEPVRLVQEGGKRGERLFLYLTIIIAAPICEELVFRGGIFRYLHHRLPLAAACGSSAFFFALIHFNLFSFLPLMVLGVALALAYRESGSIFSSIFLHAIFNSISLGLILFTQPQEL